MTDRSSTSFMMLRATFAGFLLVGAAGGDAAAQGLDEVVRAAIASNPLIGIATSNREAVDQELRRARGNYLPQIDLSGGIGKERISTSVTRARVTGRSDAGSLALVTEEASVTATQRVFDGFETDSEVWRQRYRVESAAKRVYESSEDLGLDAIEAYIEVARQRELRKLAEDHVQVHVDTLRSMRERLARGAGSSADVAQTEARLARSRATLSQTINDLQDAEALYLRIVGQAPGNVSRPAIKAADLPTGLEAALEQATKNNPTVAVFDTDVKVSDAAIDVASAPFYPRLNIEAEGVYNNNIDGATTWERSSQVMLRARWNLYRGGSDIANKRQAVARHAEAKNRRFNSHIETQEEMRRSWNALMASRDRVGSLGQAVQFNVQTRDAYRQQFNVAQRSLLDVLDAENELFVSRGQLISAQNNEQVASYRILAVAGNLLKTLGVAAPAQADPAPRSFFRDLLP